MQHKKIWINGSFDVLHMGHIRLFQTAKELFPLSTLVVGVDSDRRVSEMKGENRPINNLYNRVEFLKAISVIDKVIPFDSEYELEGQIQLYSPDYMIIGNDYIGKRIVGEKYIGKVIYVPRYGGLSTTGILGS